MAAEAKHREAIVNAAANLFRQRGYAATGMNDIVAESGAPKGSLYHYFPEGKAQIGEAALALAGRTLEARIEGLLGSGEDPALVVGGLMRRAAAALEESGFRYGCTVAGVVVDTPPGDGRTMRAADGAMALWRQALGRLCEGEGMAADRAAFVASVAISIFEGALLQARAARDKAPMLAAAEAVAMVINAEMRRG